MTGRELRGKQRISKSKAKRVEYKKILIATEGINTEPQYFERFSAYLKTKAVRVVAVRPVGVGRDPLTVVEEAERRRATEKREGDAYDDVWCVVDVDEHATLERACITARRKGINMAINSPSFEIWLIWHFQEQTSWVDRSDLSRTLQSRWGFSGKDIPEKFPLRNFEMAIARAGKCERVQVKHTPPNPHSSVPDLIRVLLDAHMKVTP